MLPSDQRDLHLQEIARRILGFDSLVARNLDRYDFMEVAVWQVRAALGAAYDAGYAAAGAHHLTDVDDAIRNGSTT